jgi:hypothetical protein
MRVLLSTIALVWHNLSISIITIQISDCNKCENSVLSFSEYLKEWKMKLKCWPTIMLPQAHSCSMSHFLPSTSPTSFLSSCQDKYPALELPHDKYATSNPSDSSHVVKPQTTPTNGGKKPMKQILQQMHPTIRKRTPMGLPLLSIKIPMQGEKLKRYKELVPIGTTRQRV